MLAYISAPWISMDPMGYRIISYPISYDRLLGGAKNVIHTLVWCRVSKDETYRYLNIACQCNIFHSACKFNLLKPIQNSEEEQSMSISAETSRCGRIVSPIIHPLEWILLSLRDWDFGNGVFTFLRYRKFTWNLFLVGGFNQPLWKMMDFVSWDDDIPNMMGKS